MVISINVGYRKGLTIFFDINNPHSKLLILHLDSKLLILYLDSKLLILHLDSKLLILHLDSKLLILDLKLFID